LDVLRLGDVNHRTRYEDMKVQRYLSIFFNARRSAATSFCSFLSFANSDFSRFDPDWVLDRD
jgi:hypothetical protein